MTQVLAEFKKTPKAILLITMKKGSVALNFTETDSVFFLDPEWNPQVAEMFELIAFIFCNLLFSD
jgi:SNF2 family DNA or RNA helicase